MIRVPAGAIKKPKRVGRGPSSGLGKTCGRGQKGQHARNTVRRGFEGGQMPLYRRVARRGFSRVRFLPFSAIVHLADLEKSYEKDEAVTMENLVAKKLVRKRVEEVKILADGELSKALKVQGVACSASAAKKIVAAGGSVEGAQDG